MPDVCSECGEEIDVEAGGYYSEFEQRWFCSAECEWSW